MRIIGLTGGIGSGKSTASAYLKKLGYAIIDADQIAREIVEPGSPVLNNLVSEFGPSILSSDGSLDRKELGSIVFSDEDKKERLDEITHGEILLQIREQIRHVSGRAVFLDVPLLYETGMDRLADQVWVVDAEDELRIRRVTERDGLSVEEVKSRISRQMSGDEKRRLADRILSNSGTPTELYAQINQLLGEIE